MSESKIEENNSNDEARVNINIEDKLDPGLKEVFNNGDKSKIYEGLSKEQIEVLKKTLQQEFNLDIAIESINIDFPKKRVIYVDGKDQLVYDNGEFLIEDTIDSKKTKKKISKQKAMENYIEFFVRYTLNPLIEEKKINDMTKQIIKVNEETKKVIRTKTEKLEEVKKVKKDDLVR